MSFDLENEEKNYREQRKNIFKRTDVKDSVSGENEKPDLNKPVSESEKMENKSVAFSAKFMWSAFFCGPFVSYFVHRSELKRSGKSFFWFVFLVCFIPQRIVTAISRYIEHACENISITAAYIDPSIWWYSALDVVMRIAVNLFMAFVAQKRFEKICHSYDEDAYYQGEKKGVMVGVILWIALNMIVMLRS
ncbi:hypothetical protein [Fibrobacter sp. UWB7]|uniref:hypothetical protein n=1 Tax=Fibrobacter sp. UWB7 TaxID=1896206 RepID=UPI00091EE628|nr:hypothetical protein [Fibrobacter sp. UWB7]SHM24850.1 hypothetical protein SAMN05720467_1069 [Fibrobacter sp. UWB7]